MFQCEGSIKLGKSVSDFVAEIKARIPEMKKKCKGV